ncbi:hypothetical protein D3C75_952780 [compost metagenome]
MQGHEFVDQRHHETLAVGHPAGHAQQALGFGGQVADRAPGLVAGVQQVAAVLQESLSGLGQADLAGAAIEQAGLQAFLEAGDLPADM